MSVQIFAKMQLRWLWHAAMLGAAVLMLSAIQAAATQHSESIRLVWRGWDEDKVSYNNGQPDSKIDHRFRLTLDFDAPQEVVLAALEQPEDQLMGLWQVLCHNPSPQSFEPLTLSGRFYMDIGADGHITGRFGANSIRGTVDKSGAASGTAKSATENISWEGAITRPAKKKPMTGRGTLKFDGGNQQCFSGSWWSN